MCKRAPSPVQTERCWRSVASAHTPLSPPPMVTGVIAIPAKSNRYSNSCRPLELKMRFAGDCMFCEGSGKCEECHGAGIDPHLNSAEIKCSHCNSTGICPECEGTGKAASSRQQYKGNVLIYGALCAVGLIAFFALFAITNNRWVTVALLVIWQAILFIVFYRASQKDTQRRKPAPPSRFP